MQARVQGLCRPNNMAGVQRRGGAISPARPDWREMACVFDKGLMCATRRNKTHTKKNALKRYDILFTMLVCLLF